MTDPSAVAASLAIREEPATQVSFALTGLLKREAFCVHLNHLLRSRSKQDAVTTVILFNIEHLRDINETHGRHVGDQLLRCIAERLRRRFGEGDNLAYFGGGIFVAVFNEHRHLRDALHDSATAVFGQPFAIGGCPIPATVKCGLARYPVNGRDAETLLHFAEGALERIRERREVPPHRLQGLSEFPVDSLKIDRSFISRLSDQPQSQVVVSTIIALARAYGLRTVAEGVETIQQLEILAQLRCRRCRYSSRNCLNTVR